MHTHTHTHTHTPTNTHTHTHKATDRYEAQRDTHKESKEINVATFEATLLKK
jgi:hypothetical protein